MREPTIVTAPTVEPLTLSELIEQLNLDDDSAQLENLTAYLQAVRQHVERIAGVAMLTQTLEWTLDGWPSPTRANPWGGIRLPRPPVQSVTSVKYVDTDGVEQTWAASNYTLNTREVPARIDRAYNVSWPSIRAQPNAITIRYIAGYTSAGLIPADLRAALRLAVGSLYEYREDLLADAPAVSGLLTRLLAPHRVWVAA